MPGKIDLRNNDFDFKGQGLSAVAYKNSTTNIDFKIPEDFLYINGGELLTKDNEFGDYIEMEIIDKDNVLGYGSGTILQTYIKNWYVSPTNKNVVEVPYGGVVPKDLYIRVKYTSVGTVNDVKVALNFFMHKEKQ